MRKNEGNKRKFIDQDSIDEISRIYADFEESSVSKIFDYTDFGYRRVKVLRPLRIDLQFDAEKLESFKASKEFGKLSDSDQNAVSAYIEQQFGDSKDYAWFENTFLNNLPLSKVSKGLKNALIAAFGVQNPDAEAVEINGEVQMDSELTDYENIPLNQDIAAYMAKEVLPHAPDAVIDTSYTDAKDGQVGVVGYEINFNRYFYVFEQPRHPNEIMAEIKELSAEVAQLLGEV